MRFWEIKIVSHSSLSKREAAKNEIKSIAIKFTTVYKSILCYTKYCQEVLETLIIFYSIISPKTDINRFIGMNFSLLLCICNSVRFIIQLNDL